MLYVNVAGFKGETKSKTSEQCIQNCGMVIERFVQVNFAQSLRAQTEESLDFLYKEFVNCTD